MTKIISQDNLHRYDTLMKYDVRTIKDTIIKVVIPNTEIYGTTLKLNDTVSGDYVDWGDGNVTMPSSGTTLGAVSHTYSTYGTYIIRIKNCTEISGQYTLSGIEKPVTFYMTELYLGNALTTIGNRAFSSYTYESTLKTLTISNELYIPNSVTTIGDYAFYRFNSVKGCSIGDSNSNSTISIGSHAFDSCIISRVTFNKVPLSIGTSAFENGQVTIIDFNFQKTSVSVSQITISSKAFKGTDINKFVLRGATLVVGDSIFSACQSLQMIEVDSLVFSATGYTNNPLGVLFSDSYITGSYYSTTQKVSMSSPYDTHTFYIPNTLSTFVYHNILPSIGMFEGMTSLLRVRLDIDGIYTNSNVLQSYAFKGCTGLRVIELEFPFTAIGENAFNGCTNITYVEIPSTVQIINDGAFSDCTNLAYIKLNEGLRYLGERAFSSCSSLKGITLPNSLYHIDSYAFSGCSSLVTLDIPNGVTVYGSYATSGCSALKYATIGDGVTALNNTQLVGCTALKTLTLGKGITSISPDALSSLSNATLIRLSCNRGDIPYEPWSASSSALITYASDDRVCMNDFIKPFPYQALTPSSQAITSMVFNKDITPSVTYFSGLDFTTDTETGLTIAVILAENENPSSSVSQLIYPLLICLKFAGAGSGGGDVYTVFAFPPMYEIDDLAEHISDVELVYSTDEVDLTEIGLGVIPQGWNPLLPSILTGIELGARLTELERTTYRWWYDRPVGVAENLQGNGNWFGIANGKLYANQDNITNMLKYVSGYNPSVAQTLKHNSSGVITWTND